MSISASLVKELRQKTGAGLMDCKKALVEASGDTKEAIKILRTNGLAQASKKASRTAKEGRVFSYLHLGGKIGVLVELNCETDFVAKTEDFNLLGKEIAMQIAASCPQYVKKEDITEEKIEEEMDIYREQAKKSGKPEKVWDKMAEGKLEKYFKEVCLLEQPFVKEPKTQVKDHISSVIAKLGENIMVGKFARFKVGEDEA